VTQLSATNRKSIREAEKAAAEFEQHRINFLVSAMGLPQGRLWFHDLLTFCQCFTVAPTFETNRDYLALGQRNVGMRTFADIMTHCPGQFTTMQQEANDRNALLDIRQQPNPGRDAGGSEFDPADYYTADAPDGDETE
jgi:hypothetical protein